MNILNVGYRSANYYVLESHQTRLLLDVGWPGTFPLLMASLRRKNLTLSALQYLCCTHYHPDHAGLVQELKQAGLQHIILENQRAAAQHLKTYMKAGSGYQDLQLADSLSWTLAASRSNLARIGFAGEIIATPGHSDDSISLLLDDGTAFVGDLTAPILVEADSLTAKSWDRLRQQGARLIYPGHGPPWAPN